MRSGIEGRDRASADGSYIARASRDQTRDRAFRNGAIASSAVNDSSFGGSALWGDTFAAGTPRRIRCDVDYDDGPLDFCDLGIVRREVNAGASRGLRGPWLKVGCAILLVTAMALGGVAAVAQSQFKDRERLRHADGVTFRANGRSLDLSLRTVWSRWESEPTYVIRLPADKFSSEDMLAYGKAFPESVVILQPAKDSDTIRDTDVLQAD
jgi:hypothetical protein